MPIITAPHIAEPTMPSIIPSAAPNPALAASRVSRPNAHSKPIAPTNGPMINPSGGKMTSPPMIPTNAPSTPRHEAPNFLAILYDAGNGVKEDKITAYAWWTIGAKRGDEAPRNNLDFLETKLTPEQITQAKVLVMKLEKEMAAGKP